MDNATGDHQAGIEGTTGDTTQRVPCSIVKPVPELVEAIRNEILSRAKVEPWIDCFMMSAKEHLGDGRGENRGRLAIN